MNDDVLDQLYALQNKRAAAIREKGINFRIQGSTKEFRAIVNTDGTLTAEGSATIGRYQIITSARGQELVTSTTKLAGQSKINIVSVSGSMPVYCKKYSGIQQTLSAVTYHWEGSQLQVIPGSLRVGDIIKMSGSYYKVSSKSPAVNGLETIHLSVFDTAPPAPVATPRTYKSSILF